MGPGRQSEGRMDGAVGTDGRRAEGRIGWTDRTDESDGLDARNGRMDGTDGWDRCIGQTDRTDGWGRRMGRTDRTDRRDRRMERTDGFYKGNQQHYKTSFLQYMAFAKQF
jgi:hypothetical protein